MTRRILCYGDSNTFGTGPMDRLGADPIHPKVVRWAGVMAAALGDGYDVVVEGLPGRTTVFDDPVEGEYRNGLRTLQAILESHRPIDLMILMLGTNDLKQRFGLGPQDVALGVQRLLRTTAALGVVGRCLVVCPPPVREAGDLAEIFRGAEARSVGLPDQMARFARENGAAFFDAGTVIAVDPVDGVHYSAESHRALGEALAEIVQDLLG